MVYVFVKINTFVLMPKRVEYLVALINQFGRKYELTDKEAYLYLKEYGAISIFDDCYEYLHTQSFEHAAESLAGYCLRNGGTIS